MKKILVLTSVLMLAAVTAGCERCCGGMFRGAQLFGPQPATVYDACPTDSCGDACGPCGTAAPATIIPGPETYAPAPIQ